jgi:hypothetical protein
MAMLSFLPKIIDIVGLEEWVGSELGSLAGCGRLVGRRMAIDLKEALRFDSRADEIDGVLACPEYHDSPKLRPF